jgi:hypothetical protein
MLYVFFWVIPRRQTPGNHPEENIQQGIIVCKDCSAEGQLFYYLILAQRSQDVTYTQDGT